MSNTTNFAENLSALQSYLASGERAHALEDVATTENPGITRSRALVPPGVYRVVDPYACPNYTGFTETIQEHEWPVLPLRGDVVRRYEARKGDHQVKYYRDDTTFWVSLNRSSGALIGLATFYAPVSAMERVCSWLPERSAARMLGWEVDPRSILHRKRIIHLGA